MTTLYYASLNSGSNGNCYYVGNDCDAVLIDAGISCRETEKRMKRLQLDPARLRAVFISHEHGDHITGLTALSRKFNLPVYITPRTLQHANLPIDPALVYGFQAQQPVTIGGLSITAFPKPHDAADPHSFVVDFETTRVGVFTDIGLGCTPLNQHFRHCDAAILESNYCETMLENGSYPFHLKQRIRGGKGHLSNTQALELFRTQRGSRLRHLMLGHLSKNNNKPELVEQLFTEVAGQVKITVASRYAESALFSVSGTEPLPISQPPAPRRTQLSLF